MSPSQEQPPYPCDNCSVDVVSTPLPPTPLDAGASSGSGSSNGRHPHPHQPQQEQPPRDTPPRSRGTQQRTRGPSLEPSGCAGQPRSPPPPPPPSSSPATPPPPSATATARWYCRECGEVFCYGCVGALHAHGTRRAGHTRERVVASPPPAFLTPLVRPATALLVLLLLHTLFFYERPSFLATGGGGGGADAADQAAYLASEHCPLATLCKRAAKRDMLLYYHLKPYLSDQCDVEDSVWGFFEDAWVRGLLLPLGRDSWYLLLVQCKHVAIGYAVALLASPLLCAPLAAAATLAALLEVCTPPCAATRAVERWATRPLARLLAAPLAAFASLGSLAAFSQALAWAAQLLPFGGGAAGGFAAAARDRRPAPPLTEAFAASPWRHAGRCFAHGYAVAAAVFRETALAAAAAAFLVRVCGLAAAEWRLRSSPLAAAAEAAAGWAGWGEEWAAQRAAFVAVSGHAEPVSGLLEAVLRSLVGDMAGASSVPSACATGLVLFSVYQLTSGRGGWAWPGSLSPGFLLSTLKEAVTGS